MSQASAPLAATPTSPATSQAEPSAPPEPGQPANDPPEAPAPSPPSEPGPDATPFARGARGQESDFQAEPAADPPVVAQVQDSPLPTDSLAVADDDTEELEVEKVEVEEGVEGSEEPVQRSEEANDEDGPSPAPDNESATTESVAAQVAAAPTVEAWCAGTAPAIQASLRNILFSRFEDPLAFPGAVDTLHQLLRDVEGLAPPEIANALALANASVLELEPVLQPAGWDWDNVDRAAVGAATDTYNSATSDIDHYNALTCGLELGMLLPDDNDIDDGEMAASDGVEPSENTPRPTSDPLDTFELSDEEFELAVLALQSDVPGITEAEARCMIQAFLAADVYGDDLEAMLTKLAVCGLSLDRLEQLTEE